MNAIRPPESLLLLRWVMVGLGLPLGLALVGRGNVLIGLLICAMAATRGAFLMTWSRRRRAWAEARSSRRPRQR